jgi:hypothetical protein
MGLLKKAAEKVVKKIEEVQVCKGCGCNFTQTCGNCTRSDCHCSEERQRR